jgi:hypothetical protein
VDGTSELEFAVDRRLYCFQIDHTGANLVPAADEWKDRIREH